MTTPTVTAKPSDQAAAAKRLTIGATVTATVTSRNQHGATVTVKGNKGFIPVTSPGAADLKKGDTVEVTIVDLPEGNPARLAVLVAREQIEALASKWGATLKDRKPVILAQPELTSLPALPSSLTELQIEPESANDEPAPDQKVKGQPVTGKVVHFLTKTDGDRKGQPYAVLVELNELKMTALLLGIDLGRTKLKDLKKGSPIAAVIADVNPNGKVKLSVKEWEQLERQEERRKQLASVKKGMPVTGKISRIELYGVFVKVSCDGFSFDGLVHVSEVPESTSSAKRAYLESLTLGDEIQASVLKVDRETGKVAFTLLPVAKKQFFAEAKKHEGKPVDGTIVAVLECGVLVNIGAVVGLVHVGKVGDAYLAELAALPPKVVRGKVLKVLIDEVDTTRERVHLSLAPVDDEDEWSIVDEQGGM